MKRLSLFICLFFGYACSAIAQNNCEQSIKQAEDFYAAGDYDNCIQLLEKANIDCPFSKKKKELVLELLAKAYLEQDNLPMAEKATYDLLKNNPHYELKENADHEDFEILVEKFDVHPLFSIGARNTVMQPGFKTVRTYSVLDDLDYSAPYKAAETVLLYYIIGEYEFKKTYSLNADIITYQLSYTRAFSRPSNLELYYMEDLSFLEIPVYLKKYFLLGRNFSIYTCAGAGYLRMLGAEGNIGISYLTEDVFNGSTSSFVSTASADVLSMRNRNSYEWLAGLGVGFKFRGLGIFIDARYTGGLNSITNPATRYTNSPFVNNYYYVDNSVKMNKYEVGLSLSYTLKNVIKKVR
ncbi:MAG: hypothetical protein WAQ28_09560 [Bacteroidia bacterium]